MREDWLDLLEKTKTDGNTATTDAASSNSNVTHVAAAEQPAGWANSTLTQQSVEATAQEESLREKSESEHVQPVQQQMPLYAPRNLAASQYDRRLPIHWDQQAVQPPPQWFPPSPEARSECREQWQSWADDGSMSQPAKFIQDIMHQVPNGYWQWDPSWQYQ